MEILTELKYGRRERSLYLTPLTFAIALAACLLGASLYRPIAAFTSSLLLLFGMLSVRKDIPPHVPAVPGLVWPSCGTCRTSYWL